MSDANLNLCFHCGQTLTPGMKFCGHCGTPSGVTSTCPKCGAEVPSGNFCGQCGHDMRNTPADTSIVNWHRGDDDFAVHLSSSAIAKGGNGFEVRHGSKALFFENGRLIEVAESGRYTTREGGLLNKLFGKKRNLSAVLVDAGDVVLPFKVEGVKTADGLLVNVTTDIVIRVEDPNAFFVNIMKEQKTFTNHELRAMFFAEVCDAIEEGIAPHAFDGLRTNKLAKKELAARLESHFRTTFARSGFGFGQVRSLNIDHGILHDSLVHNAEAEAEARAMEAKAKSDHRKAKVEIDTGDLKRDVRKGELAGARSDLGIKAEGQSVSLDDRGLDKTHDLNKKRQDVDMERQGADLLEKRLEVYKQLKGADVTKLKTDEDFRKFRLEVDRDQSLDAAEWKIFEDEIRWLDQDKERDRNFLLAKIDEQQGFDLARLKIINNGTLLIEEKKQQLSAIDLLAEAKLKAFEKEAEVEMARARATLARSEVTELGEKEIKVQKHLKDLAMQKATFNQALETEQDKALARHEIVKLEIEEKKLKSDIGLGNLEKMKAIRRADQFERDLHQQEVELRQLEARLREESERHRMRLDEMQLAGKLEGDRRKDIATMSTSQLIAISGQGQAEILGELAKTETLKGMTAEEILAMNDPAALGRALEERAKNTSDGEVKAMYEQMLSQVNSSMDQLAGFHREDADRLERMFNKGMDTTGGHQQSLAQAERNAADRVERMAESSIHQMGGVASGRMGAASGTGGITTDATGGTKIQICSGCRQEVDSKENFCPNCGNKMY